MRLYVARLEAVPFPVCAVPTGLRSSFCCLPRTYVLGLRSGQALGYVPPPPGADSSVLPSASVRASLGWSDGVSRDRLPHFSQRTREMGHPRVEGFHLAGRDPSTARAAHFVGGMASLRMTMLEVSRLRS